MKSKTQNNYLFIGQLLIIIAMTSSLALYGCTEPGNGSGTGTPHETPKTALNIDDWQYDGSTEGESAGGGIFQKAVNAIGGVRMESMAMDAAVPSAGQGTIGYSVGGAKDINNFRANIENGYFPLTTDITYEGLFYDYYFDRGQAEECETLFCPSYTYALSQDPFSEEDEYYLSVGLNSGLKQEDFERKKLNLVVVLDISGSMGSAFNNYYYDSFGNKLPVDEEAEEDEDADSSKMEIAAKSVVALLKHLKGDDRFGMVLFNSGAAVAKPLNFVGETDMDAIEDHILEIKEGGGTYMSGGYEKATGLYEEYKDIDSDVYENRIIFLTDAMPNIGETSEGGLLDMTKDNADDGIHTTFIGIGVDFNTELIESITKIRGANYYSVHSAPQFRKRMDDEFEYMVTPLVFDLRLKLDADGFEIEKVYGSPEADEATGEIMKVNTLFPSSTEGGQTKGGIVLLKLSKLEEDASLVLKTTFEDRNGKEDSDQKEIVFDDVSSGYYQNTGIRKGILLSRYANLMKNWIIDERRSIIDEVPIEPVIYRCPPDGREDIPPRCGIIEPPMPVLNRWERKSVDLEVSGHYKDLFDEFADYFEEETKAIGDDTLDQELDILRDLAGFD